MPPEQVDQQLEWDDLGGFCQFWNANAQTVRPAGLYTARRVGVLLARFDDNRRGPGVIKLEEVTDPEQPGRVFAEWAWHSDELGPPGSPTWLLRGMGPKDFKVGEQYRIVVHSTPGWEEWDEDRQEWKGHEEIAAIRWARSTSGDKFPRGEWQSGYNYRDATGKWKSSSTVDHCFMLGTEELKGYMLLIYINPEGAGKIELSPNKGWYLPGEQVTLTAIPNEGNEFVSWSGDATGADPTITVVMDGTKTIMANFEGTGFPDIPIISDIIAWIKSLFTALYEWLKAQFLWLLAEIEKLFRAVLNAFLAPIITAIDWLKQTILDVWNFVTVTIPETLEWLKQKLLETWNWVTQTIPATLAWIKEQVLDIWDELGKVASAIAEIAKNIFDTVVNALTSVIDAIWAEISSIFESLMPDLDTALEYNSPEVRAEIMSWFPTGTAIWDWFKALIKFTLRGPWILADVMSFLWAKIKGEDIEPMQEELVREINKVTDATEGVKDFFLDEVLDPITDWFEEKWNALVDKVKEIFGAIWEAIKVFFTEILPDWFRSLYEKLRAAMQWVWDKATDLISTFFDQLVSLFRAIAPISPGGGMGAFSGITKIGLLLAGGLGLMTVAGHLVHPLHTIGLGQVSAMVYDMSNYKVLTGAMIGAMAALAIRTPATYFFNDLLRPWLPSPRDSAQMRSRQYISEQEYRQLLAYQGLPDQWHKHMDKLTETRVGYFALAAVAKNGVFDRELFHRDLRRAGYAKEMIKLLLNMYEKTAAETVQGMMSGAAIKRFKEGFTTEGQFHNELALLGYSEQQWPVFLAAAQLDYAYDYLNDLVAAYRDAVRKGNISMDGYRTALLGLGMVPERVEGYVLRERARLKPDEPLGPTSPAKPEYETDAGRIKADTIRRQRRKELITRDQEIAGLQGLGMSPDHASAIANNDDVRLAEKAGEE
jgi:hypothetical protein